MPVQPPRPLPEPWLLLALSEIQGMPLRVGPHRTEGNNRALFSSGSERGVEGGKGKVTWAVPVLQTGASSLGKHQLGVVKPQGAANSLPAFPWAFLSRCLFLPAPSPWLQLQPRTILEVGTGHSLPFCCCLLCLISLLLLSLCPLFPAPNSRFNSWFFVGRISQTLHLLLSQILCFWSLHLSG